MYDPSHTRLVTNTKGRVGSLEYARCFEDEEELKSSRISSHPQREICRFFKSLLGPCVHINDKNIGR